METTSTITINRPIDDVFSYASDINRMPAWMTGVTAARMLSDTKEKGARFVATYLVARRPVDFEFKITRWDPKKVFGFATEKGPMKFKGHLEFRGKNGSTEVTSVIESGPDSLATRLLFTIARPLYRRATRHLLKRELEALKVAVDS
ncbi:hypothetical protein MNBD_ACTINO02-2182 [hydrothermal vent metagenome]|uniref:SRPBCC family protein n=1 Tax=hydrothermal vent metagenome TaxID=652676 RepID=A0A3B0TCG2_9ZZZZ